MSRFFEYVVNRKKKMAFVNGSERVINVTIIDLAGTHSINQNLSFITVNAKEFVQNIPITFSNCKSVILSVFDVYSADYPNNMEFCKAIQAQMKKHDIRHQFISSEFYFFSTALIVTNVRFQSPRLFILIKDDKIIISGSYFKLSQAGHQLIGYKQIPLDENITSEKFIAAISSFGNTYRNIIAIAEKPKTSAMSVLKKTDFKEKKVHFIENINQHKNWFAIELSKWQMFDFYNQYFFLPICTRKFVITDQNDNEIISTNIGHSLPLKKSCSVSNFPSKYFLKYFDENIGEFTTLQEIILQQKCHQNEIVFTVNTDNFPMCQTLPQVLPEIQFLPQTCAKSATNCIPVISFYDNLSFICACKNNDIQSYSFLDDWNGVYGTDLVVYFEGEKPIIGKRAVEAAATKPKSVIYDIIKIMSMPQDSITVNPAWRFSISHNANYPVLLEFDNFNGSQNAATPAFIMAILLKEHFKVIKNETGETLKEVAFCFLNNYNEEEKNRIQQQLKESCQLLKVKCRFLTK